MSSYLTDEGRRSAIHDIAPDRLGTDHVFEVPAERLLQNWEEAHARALAYLDAMGIPAADHAALVDEAIEGALAQHSWPADGDAIAETLRALRRLLPVRYPSASRSWLATMDEFLAWRLDAYLSDRFSGDRVATDVSATAQCGRFTSMPPLNRGHMVPDPIERRFFRRLFINIFRRPGQVMPGKKRPLRRLRRTLPWVHVAHRRRLLLFVLVLIPSIVASGFMIDVLPHQGRTGLEAAIVLLFGALFGWISIGFWTAVMGFFTLIGGRKRFAITNLDPDDAAAFGVPPAIAPEAHTAIVMPICEEPVDRVFAGLRAIYQSLQRTGASERFHFFILSDSNDPSTFVKEEAAWAAWCREVNGFDHIFYRRRHVRLKRKSGNVADFCRRWGRSYRYMIMLDADSVMAGSTLVRLVKMMERRPEVGMIQTVPIAVNRHSLLARVQQFSGRLYGPMFAAGLHFWQLGDGQYWGHNTIIRIAPFMEHCALPRLPGKPPLGGEILSHDFVEAALMGRAGWSLWLAFDLGGSYEEVPSTLLEEMKRDRRWCQGNLQHLRLLFSEGLFGAHRALFINGVLSYVSALLWFGFLTVSTTEAIVNAMSPPDYFPNGASLFPEWPVWQPDWAMSLLAVTASILFLPKVLGILLIVFKWHRRKAYGGMFRLTLSMLLEILLSSLLAPIRMVFHSRFVVQTVLGRSVTWRSQGREDAETSWRVALRYHGFDTVFASAWGISLYWLNPDYFWWVTPIIGALILSVPVSVYSSRVSLGERTRRWGLFLIPEESEPPQELVDLQDNLVGYRGVAAWVPAVKKDSVVCAIVDPGVNALHCALLGRPRSLTPTIAAARRQLLDDTLRIGVHALGTRDRQILLTDPHLVDEVHERVWRLPDRRYALQWGGRPGESVRPELKGLLPKRE
ncbi:MAG: glucans biosynthesis glucosyltransferase MdoH [Gammaproteobacteria bacterium]|jgi:membrane glycosyltransferase